MGVAFKDLIQAKEIELDFLKGRKQIILYEIKTRNK